MMSLWADDATFTNNSTGTTYVGSDNIRSLLAGFGLVHPSSFLARSFVQDEDRGPRRRGVPLLRVPRHRQLRHRRVQRLQRDDDRERHVPRRRVAPRGRQLAVLENDCRAEARRSRTTTTTTRNEQRTPRRHRRLRRRRLRRLQWRGGPPPWVSAAKRGRCSECVPGRLPLLEALRDELGPLLLAPAVQHLEV